MAPVTGDALVAGLQAFNAGFSFGFVVGGAVVLVAIVAYARWRDR